MSRFPTVTIVIPAYNEAANIAALLQDIAGQVFEGVRLVAIAVLSDGSSDETVAMARSFKHPNLLIKKFKTRKGRAYRQVQYLQQCRSTFAILLDGDIRLPDPHTLQQLIKPLLKGKVQMTSCALRELPPRTWVEQMLYVSMRLKEILFATLRGSHNLYTCHGPARAFGRALYRSFRDVESEGEDMSTYLQCLSMGYLFAYVPEAVVWYRLPKTLGEHCRQSIRYYQAQQRMEQLYEPELVQTQLTITLPTVLLAGWRSLPLVLRYPLHTVCYMGVWLGIRGWKLSALTPQETWKIASSKEVTL